ncbi:MAG: hypothetical protein L6W00_27460 [Lentisphaeria bacterium]|nr:MAG: hypothetical protein L6W00_27460 [Lentisphaeria bacterium]
MHFTAADGSEPGRHEVTAPLSQVFHYHLLLGSEQVFDFFLADSPANAGIRNSAKPTDLVTLNVFDLGDFYREHDFRKGDALLCKVTDYDAGHVQFRYLSGDERRESDLAAFVQQFDKALDQVIDRFEKLSGNSGTALLGLLLRPGFSPSGGARRLVRRISAPHRSNRTSL